MLRRPRVPYRRIATVQGSRAEGEFVHIGLADEDGTFVQAPLHHRSRVRRIETMQTRRVATILIRAFINYAICAVNSPRSLRSDNVLRWQMYRRHHSEDYYRNRRFNTNLSSIFEAQEVFIPFVQKLSLTINGNPSNLRFGLPIRDY